MKPSERLLLCLPPAGQHAEEAQDVRGISQQGLHPGCVPTHAPCTAGPCTHVLTHTCTHMLSYTRTHTCTHMLSYTCTHVHTHVHTCVQCPPHAYCAYAGMWVPVNTRIHTVLCLPPSLRAVRVRLSIIGAALPTLVCLEVSHVPLC